MGVGVQRVLRGSVAEPGLDDLDALAVPDEQGGVVVAHVVEPGACRGASRRGGRPELNRDHVSVQRPAVRLMEHQPILPCPEPLQVRRERIGNDLGERQCSV